MTSISNSLKSLKAILEEKKPSRVVLVSSDYLISKLDWAIIELKELISSDVKIIQVPNGEEAKEWDTLRGLLNDFTENGLDRKSLVIALGGGSITDLVGFASSIYLRGINYVNIPTTLLGQVDSGIGGKTAINFQGYKNQIGSFYEPIAIIVDVRFLETLNEAQIIDGLAEIIKAGLIKNPSILDIIKSHSFTELKEKPVIEELILKAIKVKEYFISIDPRDNGIRQILNFGHTIAHALELKYGLSHGQAVLIGMVEELRFGERLGETKSEVINYLNEIIRGLNITFEIKKLKIDWESILHDKKVLGSEINLPIVKKIGEAELIKVKLDKLASLIN